MTSRVGSPPSGAAVAGTNRITCFDEFNETARTAENVNNLLRGKKAVGQPLISYLGTGPEDEISDLSMFDRSFIIGPVPGEPIMGITTVLNVFQGAVAASKVLQTRSDAQELGDKRGERLANLNLAFRVTQATGGASFGAVRGLTLASYLKHAKIGMAAPSLLGRATYLAGMIGSAIFGLSYVFIGLASIYQLFQSNRFSKKMKTEQQKANYLNITGADVLERVKKEARKATIGEIAFLRNETLSKGAKVLNDLFKELKKQDSQLLVLIPQKIDAKEMIEKFFSEMRGVNERVVNMNAETELDEMGIKNDNLLYNSLLNDPLARLGLQLKIDALAQKRENKLARLTGRSVDKTNDTLQTIQKSMRSKDLMTKMVLLTSIVGIAVTVIGMLTVPLLLAILAPALLALMWIGVDGYSVYQAFKGNGSPGKLDSKVITVNMMIGIIATTAALILTSVFTAGIVPLVLIGTLGTIWLSINAIALQKINQKKKEFEFEPYRQLEESQHKAHLELAGQFFREMSKKD